MTCSRCEEPAKARGLCATHYQAARRAGELPAPKRGKGAQPRVRSREATAKRARGDDARRLERHGRIDAALERRLAGVVADYHARQR